MKIGFLGLGNMGLNLVHNLKNNGHEVIAWNRSEEKREVAREQGVEVRDSIVDVAKELETEEKKVFWSLVAAGPAVNSVLFDEGGVLSQVKDGDIVVELANSHYKESQERAIKFAEKGVMYIDCGISGGVNGARNGANLMVGGDEDAVKYIEQLFQDISKDGGYGYFGRSGSGHYVKMVHNAIEYGMMQAIAEGLNLLSMSDFDVDFSKVTEVWSNGSIIESNLIKFLHQAFEEDSALGKLSPEIGSLGTAKWAVEDALERQAPFTNIANAVFTRFESRNADEFEHRIIQAMRTVFGSHNSQERPQ